MKYKNKTAVFLSFLLANASPAFALDFAPTLDISGFATAGASMTNAVDVDFYDPIFKQKFSFVPTIEGIGQRPVVIEDTLGGIQFTAGLYENLWLTLQLVSEGENDYVVTADWLYLDWRISDEWDLEVGRVMMPFLMHSPYEKVGYVYPWTRLPLEVYNFSFSDFDGLTVRYSKLFGNTDWRNDTTLSLGNTVATSNFAVSEAIYSLDKAMNLELAFYNENARLRAGYTRGDVAATFSPSVIQLQQLLVNPCAGFSGALAPELITVTHPAGLAPNQCLIATINTPFPYDTATQGIVTSDPAVSKLLTVKNANMEIYSFGYEIELGHFVSMAEWVHVHTDDKYLVDSSSWYVFLGYNWLDITPYVTYSTYRTTDNSNRVLVNDISATYVNPFSFFGPLPIPSPQTFEQSLNQFFALANIQQSTIDVGIRYDIVTSAALKFDYRYVMAQNNTAGFFTAPPGKRVSWVTAAINVVF